MASSSSKGESLADARPSASSQPQSSAAVLGNFSSWSDLIPREVVAEDSMSVDKAKRVWEDMYRLANLKNPSETERAAFRAGVYVYGAINGTSRAGDYKTVFTLSNGTKVDASIIPRATGEQNIRKFFRANMDESLAFFKGSGVLGNYPRLVAKAAAFGVDADNVFVMADWFSNCASFSPKERALHDACFVHSVERAMSARGGKTMEQLGHQRNVEVAHAGSQLSDKEVDNSW